MGRGTGGDDIKNAHPNLIIYRKMEGVINKMLSAEDGVPIKTVKSFLSKIPSVFTGQDIIAWILRHIEVADLGKICSSKIEHRAAKMLPCPWFRKEVDVF